MTRDNRHPDGALSQASRFRSVGHAVIRLSVDEAGGTNATTEA